MCTIVSGNGFCAGMGNNADRAAQFLLPADDLFDTGEWVRDVVSDIFFPSEIFFRKLLLGEPEFISAHIRETHMEASVGVFF